MWERNRKSCFQFLGDCSEVGTVAVFAVAAAAVPEYAFKIFPGRYCDQWNSIEGLYSSIVWLEVIHF